MVKANRVAVLGLGVMGAPMARNIYGAGFEVMAWNRSLDKASVVRCREVGVKICEEPSEAVREADVVVTCVTNGDVVADLLANQIIPNAQKGTIIVDCSTIGPQVARRLSDMSSGAEMGFVDAPVSGGDVGAEAGTLTVMAGGSVEDFEKVRVVLEAVGSSINHCGPVGSGQALKMVNQVLAAINTHAMVEALALADATGVSLDQVVEVCSSGAGGSWALSNLGPRVVSGDWAPGFSLDNIIKDLRLALADGASAGLEMQAAKAALERFAETAAENGGALGTQALYLRY